MEFSGRVEYMYVGIGEDVEVKLTADIFKKLPKINQLCSHNTTHSQMKCIELCQWEEITSSVGCTGPWMAKNELPDCNDYFLFRELVSAYEKYVNTFFSLYSIGTKIFLKNIENYC